MQAASSYSLKITRKALLFYSVEATRVASHFRIKTSLFLVTILWGPPQIAAWLLHSSSHHPQCPNHMSGLMDSVHVSYIPGAVFSFSLM